MDDLVAIARVARSKGLSGEVIADVLTDFPERFEGLVDVTAVLPDATRLELKIEDVRFQNGRLLLKFAGYGSIDKAETLRDSELCVPETDAVELDADEFYDWQLEGCRVVAIDGSEIGVVRGLQRTGGTENLLVEGSGRDHLIPFAEAICVEVDIDKKLIKVDPPEGLLEF
jgi:16S rRNA processing protein RimM